MRIKIFLLFLVWIGVVHAERESEITVVNPNWRKPAISLDKSAQITPLCDSARNTACIKQWAKLARPFAVTPEGDKLPSMEYYLPSIALDNRLPSNTEMDGSWKEHNPSAPGSRAKMKKYYIDSSQPGRIRQVVMDAKGRVKKIAEGRIVFVPMDKVMISGFPTTGKNNKKKLEPVDSPPPEPPQEELNVILNEPTNAVAGQTSSPDQKSSGCVKVDKKAKSGNPTEADFCVECNEHLSKSLSAVAAHDKSFKQTLKSLLDAVVSGSKKFKVAGSQKRIKGKIKKGGDICSPDKALAGVIKNFNKKCRPIQFNDFFPDAYCQSCNKQIPAEVALAVATVESAGDCGATNEKGEGSMGLFQVDFKKHRCNGHKKGTQANKRCFLDPSNSLKYGIEKLNEKYNKVNPERAKVNSCPQWTSLSSKERDRWRRAVVSYNGGVGWLDRAVQSVEGDYNSKGRSVAMDTRQDLNWGHLGKFKGRAKKSTVSWEELRVYHFMEKLLPGNKISTGKATRNTLSSLAHTETVLGREVKGAPPGLVEFWSQYIKERQPLTCPAN